MVGGRRADDHGFRDRHWCDHGGRGGEQPSGLTRADLPVEPRFRPEVQADSESFGYADPVGQSDRHYQSVRVAQPGRIRVADHRTVSHAVPNQQRELTRWCRTDSHAIRSGHA